MAEKVQQKEDRECRLGKKLQKADEEEESRTQEDRKRERERERKKERKPEESRSAGKQVEQRLILIR
jgi:hypothetical protein